MGDFFLLMSNKNILLRGVLNVIRMLSGQWIPLKVSLLLVNFAFCMPFFGKLMTLAVVSD